MVLRFELDCFAEFGPASLRSATLFVDGHRGLTYTASSKDFAAKSLFPSALSASAMFETMCIVISSNEIDL